MGKKKSNKNKKNLKKNKTNNTTVDTTDVVASLENVSISAPDVQSENRFPFVFSSSDSTVHVL